MKNKRIMTAVLGVMLLLSLGIVFFVCQPTLLTAFKATLDTDNIPNQPVQAAESVAITPPEISATQVNTATSWKTFTDSEAGYSIQYPENFVVLSNRNKGDVYRNTTINFVLPEVNMYQAMTIQVHPNTQDLRVESFVEQLYQRLTKRSLVESASNQLDQINIGGLLAYKTDLLPGSTDFHILLPYQHKVYHFALVHGLGAIASEVEAQAIFAKILETFQVQP